MHQPPSTATGDVRPAPASAARRGRGGGKRRGAGAAGRAAAGGACGPGCSQAQVGLFVYRSSLALAAASCQPAVAQGPRCRHDPGSRGQCCCSAAPLPVPGLKWHRAACMFALSKGRVVDHRSLASTCWCRGGPGAAAARSQPAVHIPASPTYNAALPLPHLLAIDLLVQGGPGAAAARGRPGRLCSHAGGAVWHGAAAVRACWL